jgi:hypothetical protein
LAQCFALKRSPQLDSHAAPFPDFRDPHAAIRLTAHRHPVLHRSRSQAAAESVAAPLVRADALDIDVLTNSQPVNAVGDPAARS